MTGIPTSNSATVVSGKGITLPPTMVSTIADGTAVSGTVATPNDISFCMLDMSGLTNFSLVGTVMPFAVSTTRSCGFLLKYADSISAVPGTPVVTGLATSSATNYDVTFSFTAVDNTASLVEVAA
jgi:hypothetical protein